MRSWTLLAAIAAAAAAVVVAGAPVQPTLVQLTLSAPSTASTSKATTTAANAPRAGAVAAGAAASSARHKKGGGGGGSRDKGVDFARVVTPSHGSSAPFSLPGLQAADSLAFADNVGNEPANTAVCAGNGFVVEVVDSLVRISRASDGAALSTAALSDFLDDAAGLNPSSASCSYDRATRRFFLVAASDFPGLVAVATSASSDPTAGWRVRTIDVPLGVGLTECESSFFCFADAPRSAVYAGGFLVFAANDIRVSRTTFDDFKQGSFIVVAETAALASNTSAVPALLFSELGINAAGEPVDDVNWRDAPLPGGQPAFNLFPAVMPLDDPRPPASLVNAPVWLLSLPAAGQAVGGTNSAAFVWRITGIGACFADVAACFSDDVIQLELVTVPVSPFVTPGAVQQRVGVIPQLFPLLSCIRDPACTTVGLGKNPNALPSQLDAALVSAFVDFAGALKSAPVLVDGGRRLFVAAAALTRGAALAPATATAGVKWLLLDLDGGKNKGKGSKGKKKGKHHHNNHHGNNDDDNGGGLSVRVKSQGLVGARGDGNSLLYPAPALTADGDAGVVAAVLVGKDYFPSAALLGVGRGARLAGGKVLLAAAGSGPADGFDVVVATPNQGVELWGSYSGAATDEAGRFWAALQLASPACTYARWLATGGLCNATTAPGLPTRTPLINWATQLVRATPSQLKPLLLG